jgi:hypothetical protein
MVIKLKFQKNGIVIGTSIRVNRGPVLVHPLEN